MVITCYIVTALPYIVNTVAAPHISLGSGVYSVHLSVFKRQTCWLQGVFRFSLRQKNIIEIVKESQRNKKRGRKNKKDMKRKGNRGRDTVQF